MKRALLIVAAVACEREHGAQLKITPQTVGSRATFHIRIDGDISTPSGPESMHEEARLMLTVEAMGTDGRPDRLRVDVDRHDHVFHGKPKGTLSGSYDVTRDGTVTRVDGKPVSPYEIRFFHQWHDPGEDPSASLHEFRAGEVFHPTAREAQAFSIPASTKPLALTVRSASDREIVLVDEYDVPYGESDIEGHASMVLTLTPDGHTHVGDIEMRGPGSDVASVHVSTELRRLPQR